MNATKKEPSAATEPTLGSASVETKTCPQCAEEVKAAALVCRFCGYDFQGRSSIAPPAKVPSDDQPPGAERTANEPGTPERGRGNFVKALAGTDVFDVLRFLVRGRGLAASVVRITLLLATLLVVGLVVASQHGSGSSSSCFVTGLGNKLCGGDAAAYCGIHMDTYASGDASSRDGDLSSVQACHDAGYQPSVPQLAALTSRFGSDDPYR